MSSSTPSLSGADAPRDGGETEADAEDAGREDTGCAEPADAPHSDVLRTELQALAAHLKPPDR